MKVRVKTKCTCDNCLKLTNEKRKLKTISNNLNVKLNELAENLVEITRSPISSNGALVVSDRDRINKITSSIQVNSIISDIKSGEFTKELEDYLNN